jgi:hypothetical protein
MVKHILLLLWMAGWALNAGADLAKPGSAANPNPAPTDHTVGVKEHLAEQERLEKEAAVKAAAALRLKEADAATRERVLSQAGAKAVPEDELARQVQAAIKEAARPVKEAVDAVRGPSEASAAPAAPKPSTNESSGLTDSQRRTNRALDNILWDEFVEQAKPWAIGLGVGVLLLVATAQVVSHGRGKSAYRASKDTPGGSGRASRGGSGSSSRAPSRAPSRSSARSSSRSSGSRH